MARKLEGMGRESRMREIAPPEWSNRKVTTDVFSSYVLAALHNCASQDCPSYIPILANDFINTLFLYLESQPPKHM